MILQLIISYDFLQIIRQPSRIPAEEGDTVDQSIQEAKQETLQLKKPTRILEMTGPRPKVHLQSGTAGQPSLRLPAVQSSQEAQYKKPSPMVEVQELQ